jgi:hypothetical protein
MLINLGGNMKRTIIYTTILAAMLAPAGYSAEQENINAGRQVRELARNSEAKALFEHGRKGSLERRAAKSFPGQPVFPVTTLGGARQGNPSESADPSSSDGGTTTIEVTSARLALLETAASAPIIARASSVSALGKNKNSAESATIDYYDPRAQMVAPIDGATLNPTQTFAWSAGNGVDDYFLELGSCFECSDLLAESEGRNLSRTVSLPVDGRFIYATLFSLIDGNWYYIEYQFLASQGGNAFPAQMTFPASGSTLNSPQTFAWDGGYGVSAFYLRIGSCQGCKDVLDENEGQNLSRALSLPTDGRTIFARLYSLIQDTWWYYDYQYRAPTEQATHHVRVNIVNNLAYAVNVSVNGRVVGSCPAMTTAGTDIDVSTLTVSFDLIRPTLNGRPLGDTMSGVFPTYNNPSGTYNFTVGNHIGNTYYFLPLITNRTAVSLEVEVNGGLQAENRCNCVAPAGETRVASGYYLWYSNSNVRLFRNGANYRGSYIYFGVDADGAGTPLTNYVTGLDAEIELAVTKAP